MRFSIHDWLSAIRRGSWSDPLLYASYGAAALPPHSPHTFRYSTQPECPRHGGKRSGRSPGVHLGAAAWWETIGTVRRCDISWCRSVSISRSVSIRKWFFRPFEHIFWFKILIFGRSLPTPNFTGFRLKSTPVAQCLRAMPKHSSRNDLCSLCSFSKREKLHRQFLDGQTDQKLQSLF